jgi:transcriptional regulator with XRE-family HTH domain
MKSSRDRRIVHLLSDARSTRTKGTSKLSTLQRPAPRVQVPADLESPSCHALEFFGSPERNDLAPSVDGHRGDVQRRADRAAGLEVSQGGGFEHRPKLSIVSNYRQLADHRIHPGLSVLRRMGVDVRDVLPFAIMSTLSERFAEAMRDRNVTAPEVAAALGMSENGVDKIIQGKTKKLRPSTSEKASRYFKVRAEWLNYGKGPKKLDADQTGHATKQDMADAIELVKNTLKSFQKAMEMLEKHLVAEADEQRPASRKKRA